MPPARKQASKHAPKRKIRYGVLGLGHRETIRHSGFESDYEELDGEEKLWKKVA